MANPHHTIEIRCPVHGFVTISDNPGRGVNKLSVLSSMIRNLKPLEKVMLYARREDTAAIRTKLQELLRTLR